LIARGEFSIVIAGVAVASGLDADVGALSIAYVLVLAILGPLAAKFAEPIADRLLARRARREESTLMP
jgi:CPA2 family monovalent cation:H+ antiporter-2